jgi:hypothetical protein
VVNFVRFIWGKFELGFEPVIVHATALLLPRHLYTYPIRKKKTGLHRSLPYAMAYFALYFFAVVQFASLLGW